MPKILFNNIILTLTFLICLSGISSASILTFEGLGLSNYGAISQDYGDNITSLSDGIGNYLEGNGFTPDVSVSYNTVGGTNWLSYWATDYGTLVDIAFPQVNGGIAEITFSAAPGTRVVLNSFDLSGYYRTDKTAIVLEVVDGSGTHLWSPPGMGINGSSYTSFFPGLTAEVLTIRFGIDWNIGIDNINFDQTTTAAVPIPATLGLFLAGLLGLSGLRRK